MSVIERCPTHDHEHPTQRCVYAAEHKGICSIYMPSDDRGWVFDRLWSDQQHLQGTVGLLDALDAYVGHQRDCGMAHGAPDCSCGFDDLYTRVRAVVRGTSPRLEQTGDTDG